MAVCRRWCKGSTHKVTGEVWVRVPVGGNRDFASWCIGSTAGSDPARRGSTPCEASIRASRGHIEVSRCVAIALRTLYHIWAANGKMAGSADNPYRHIAFAMLPSAMPLRFIWFFLSVRSTYNLHNNCTCILYRKFLSGNRPQGHSSICLFLELASGSRCNDRYDD